MAEFEDKLNSILSDPQAMRQIMSIAKALGGNEEEDGPDGGGEFSAVKTAAAAASAEQSKPAGNTAPLRLPLEDLDPRLVQTALRLFSEYYSTDDRKTALLSALLPFLKEERYAKVDKAVQITKLSRVVRVAFELLKGGDNHV